MSRLLSAVTRATQRARTAEQARLQAMRAAREAGHNMTEIGRAAGLTKQGVRYLLNPDPRKGKQ